MNSFSKDIVSINYSLTPLQKFRLLEKIINFFITYKVIALKLNKRQMKYHNRIIEAVDNMISLINNTVKDSREISCDINLFQQFLNKKYKATKIPYLRKKYDKLSKILSGLSSKVATQDDLYLTKIIRRQVPKVDSQLGYIEMNSFDECASAYFETHKKEKYISEVISSIRYGFENLISNLSACIMKFLKNPTKEEKIVVHSAVIRYFYSVSYTVQSSVLNSSVNPQIFFNNCNYISSFSPNKLGLSSQLFTPLQMNMPVISLVHESPVINEVSRNLNSLQFYTAPIDMMKILYDVILKLDEFVKKNVLDRKFGQFASMLEREFNEKRKYEMMSFDDCFSLFFSILSTNPPMNALEISVLFQNSPDFVESMQLKYAKNTYVCAVQHILEFTDEQIVNRSDDELDLNDPLGII